MMNIINAIIIVIIIIIIAYSFKIYESISKNSIEKYIKNTNIIKKCNDNDPFTDRHIYSQYPYIEYELIRPWRRFDSIRY